MAPGKILPLLKASMLVSATVGAFLFLGYEAGKEGQQKKAEPTLTLPILFDNSMCSTVRFSSWKAFSWGPVQSGCVR